MNVQLSVLIWAKIKSLVPAACAYFSLIVCNFCLGKRLSQHTTITENWILWSVFTNSQSSDLTSCQPNLLFSRLPNHELPKQCIWRLAASFRIFRPRLPTPEKKQLKTHQMFSVHSTITGHFGLVFEEIYLKQNIEFRTLGLEIWSRANLKFSSFVLSSSEFSAVGL